MGSFSIHYLIVLLIMLWVLVMPLAVVGFVIWYVQRNRQGAPVSPAIGANRCIEVRSAPPARVRLRKPEKSAS